MTFKHIRHSCCHFAESVKQCLRPGRHCHGLHRPSPLSQRRRSGRLRICQIQGDRKLCARMASMGVYPGIEAELICPDNGGQCVLKIANSTVCLDETVSDSILVTTLPETT